MQTPPSYSAPIPAPTEYTPASAMSNAMMGANTSGMGAQSVLPEELKGFNWGAFLLGGIWPIAHSTWIGLLVWVPYIGIIMNFVLGFKGNEWAWQNRKWDSIEHFKTVQKIWMKWGIGVIVVLVVLPIIAAILFPVFAAARRNAGG